MYFFQNGISEIPLQNYSLVPRILAARLVTEILEDGRVRVKWDRPQPHRLTLCVVSQCAVRDDEGYLVGLM